MRAFARMLVVTFICLGSLAVGQEQWRPHDEDAAARVFGPRWRQLSRDSGMIFSATVIDIHSSRLGNPEAIPIVTVSLRVEHAIAGVRPHQTIAIREWAGAWSEHPLHRRQRLLLLLYPRSRLGLTSPVGGSLGQVALSEKNTVVASVFVPERDNGRRLRQAPEQDFRAPITLSQLVRAIRGARASQTARASGDRVIAPEE